MVALQEPGTTVAVDQEPSRPPAVRFVVALLALLPPITQLAYLAVKDRDAWPYLFTDDAYYYLGVARNLGAGQGSTFSGLTETNGYHPLWELSLAAVATVVRDPYLLVAAVVVVQGLLWLWLVRTALGIGRLVGSEAAATVGVAALGTLAVITGQLSFSAMESSPLLVLLLVAIRRALALPDGDHPRAELQLGGVLALVFLARLDAILTIVPLAALVALRGWPDLVAVTRRGIRLLAPTGAVLAVYVLINLAVFGTATPVSGQAKSLGAPFWNTLPVEQFLKAGQVAERPLWLGAATLVMCVVVLVTRDWRTSLTRRRLVACVGALLVGQAVLLGYLVVATSYRVWAWYFYGIALTMFCAGTLLGRCVIRWLGPAGPGVCLAVGATFAVAQVPATLFSGFSHTPRATEAVEFITTELPPDAVLAMGDRAGLVGYLADRPMLQLEGLMADAEWLRDLEDGTALERMGDEGVDYYLWSGHRSGRPVAIDGRDCTVMTEPRAGDGPKFEVTVCEDDLVFNTGSVHDQFTVWRFRPELNE